MSKKKITDFPSIEVTVKLYNTAPIDGQGLLSFCLATTDVTDDDENRLGYVGSGVGSVVVSKKDEHYFILQHEDLWYAVTEALEGEKDER